MILLKVGFQYREFWSNVYGFYYVQAKIKREIFYYEMIIFENNQATVNLHLINKLMILFYSLYVDYP